jgi:hypothetical protein
MLSGRLTNPPRQIFARLIQRRTSIVDGSLV